MGIGKGKSLNYDKGLYRSMHKLVESEVKCQKKKFAKNY